MAEALISVLLEQLVSVVYEHTKEKVKLVLNAKKDVQSFKSSLKAIQAVLEDAEKRQVTEAGVADWLQKLKDVSFEMDDVLDEWNTKLLRQQVEGEEEEEEEEEENDDAENAFKVCFPIPCDCFCFGQVKEVIHHYAISKKIKQLNEKLSLISAERENYGFRQSTYRGTDDELNIRRPITTSMIDVSKIYGREEETKRLLSMLLSESSHPEGERFLVIPIVGLGGMGKTTLTQLAYNHEKVKAHFDKKVWVCVSDPFDETKIAKAIIENLGGNSSSNELEILLRCIEELVRNKKLLLVLDDVWTEDETKWENLKLQIIMQSCAKGSRILVTTRKEGVAKMMRAITSMIHLDRLNPEDCLTLFNSLAFVNREDVSNEFSAIGKKIVKKCQGLPLAVKTLGSLMWYKITRREWEDVLNSKMWELKRVEQQVFQPLLLSYYDLNSDIKRCLLYSVIFPKDYEYNKDRLIELWMSQNYISSKENKSERQIGEKYFESLVMRSFFQDFTKDKLGNITGCKVHDIVHDFLQFLTKKECISKSVEGANQRMELPGDNFRHLTIFHDPDNPTSFPTSFYNCKNVRTLSFIDSKMSDISPILELKCLRTLNLSRNALKELPEEIGKLIHLRYMDLSRSECLKELPDSLCSLYNLQTLFLIRCKKLEKLPKAMDNLINLKHLYVWCCDRLEYLPKGIGRLKSLRALDYYYIPQREGNGDEALRLGDLGIMKQLQGSIEIENLGVNAEDVSEVEKASFGNKQDLLSLQLYFECRNFFEEKREGDEEILKAVQPHQNLESLIIRHCHAASSWSECFYWINSLHNLRFLYLLEWEFFEDLPPLGQLPSLEILQIVGMKKVKKVGFEFLGVEEEETLAGGILFPKLKSLVIESMWRLEEWEGTTRGGKEITVMPRLSSLQITTCESLKALPDFLQNIKALNSLNIIYCPYLRRENEWPKISHIPNIYFNGWRAQQT